MTEAERYTTTLCHARVVLREVGESAVTVAERYTMTQESAVTEAKRYTMTLSRPGESAVTEAKRYTTTLRRASRPS